MAKVLVETSARHVHVSKEDLEILFGPGATLTEKKRLSQPTEFVSEERVTVIGPKKELANVSILGPCRKATQIELSATDARGIGVKIEVRESGDISGTPGCILRGPHGEIVMKEGVIVAKRHVHMTPDFAKANGLSNKQTISLKIEGTGRSAILSDVICRVDPSFTEAAHIDTDESNAVLAFNGLFGEIIKQL
ncbi:MAG: phosphate propanoyltransferase [Eubacterium sp.]|jgi:putative phosphotransacetylase|nr:phosphate propanoyltransferase [Eubacterium sp.]